MTSIFLPTAEQDASLPTTANDGVPITPYRVAHIHNLFPSHKPHPWTPVRLLLLECKLSFHLDKIFVRMLIDDMQHGCNIGRTGPQFAHIAANLSPAFQQPSVTDAGIEKEWDHFKCLPCFTSALLA